MPNSLGQPGARLRRRAPAGRDSHVPARIVGCSHSAVNCLPRYFLASGTIALRTARPTRSYWGVFEEADSERQVCRSAACAAGVPETANTSTVSVRAFIAAQSVRERVASKG